MAKKRKVDNISKDDQRPANYDPNEVTAQPAPVAPSDATKFTKSSEQNFLRETKPIVFSPFNPNAGTDAAKNLNEAAQQKAAATSRTCKMCWAVSFASEGWEPSCHWCPIERFQIYDPQQQAIIRSYSESQPSLAAMFAATGRVKDARCVRCQKESRLCDMASAECGPCKSRSLDCVYLPKISRACVSCQYKRSTGEKVKCDTEPPSCSPCRKTNDTCLHTTTYASSSCLFCRQPGGKCNEQRPKCATFLHRNFACKYPQDEPDSQITDLESESESESESEEMSVAEYEVEEILRHRWTILNGAEYLVKWKGYSLEESTWEPEDNLADSEEFIQEYENRLGQCDPKGAQARKSKAQEDSSASPKQSAQVNARNPSGPSQPHKPGEYSDPAIDRRMPLLYSQHEDTLEGPLAKQKSYQIPSNARAHLTQVAAGTTVSTAETQGPLLLPTSRDTESRATQKGSNASHRSTAGDQQTVCTTSGATPSYTFVSGFSASADIFPPLTSSSASCVTDVEGRLKGLDVEQLGIGRPQLPMHEAYPPATSTAIKPKSSFWVDGKQTVTGAAYEANESVGRATSIMRPPIDLTITPEKDLTQPKKRGRPRKVSYPGPVPLNDMAKETPRRQKQNIHEAHLTCKDSKASTAERPRMKPPSVSDQSKTGAPPPQGCHTGDRENRDEKYLLIPKHHSSCAERPFPCGPYTKHTVASNVLLAVGKHPWLHKLNVRLEGQLNLDLSGHPFVDGLGQHQRAVYLTRYMENPVVMPYTTSK